MKYCKKCVMPDTRPGIVFNADGICQACVNYELRSKVDWEKRWGELTNLCSKYKKKAKDYNCIIAVSGGKDSHYQTHMMKEKLGMNPLLVTVEDNFPMTNAGVHNLKNISEAFGCDIISLKPNIKNQKIIMKYTFEKYGKPTWYIDRLIYTYPLYMALKFNIELIIYGENISFEYGGNFGEETYSAKDQIKNGVASDISFKEFTSLGVHEEDLYLLNAPDNKELDKIEPVYLSYFIPWNSVRHYKLAQSRGFRDLTHEWIRTHHIENFDQIDSRAYLIHPWMKYPKFGHATATDYASRLIRYGMLSRDEALRLVKKHDHALDPMAIDDFCNFLGYSRSEFWSIIDRFYNKDLFIKNEIECWELKNPVWVGS
ncbi:N-acetyl sugar amidotransferase [Spirochaetota bacterium]